MATKRHPRRGSLQYWPRKAASRPYMSIRHYPQLAEAKLGGFAGYKAGMTHVFVADNRPHSMTKGQSVMMPVTVLECPPIKVASIRLYRTDYTGKKISSEVFSQGDKTLAKKIPASKKAPNLEDVEKNLSSYSDVLVNVHTQPQLSGVGKKKPELFEMAVGGKSVGEKFAYAKSMLGKEVSVKDVFKEGEQLDIFSVTKGKGFQGPVKRFGVKLRQHKSEKGRRGPANVGSWTGNRSWPVPHAGQMGFHNRVERNKWLLKIGTKPEEVNAKGGFINYGNVKSDYVIIKGSLGGTTKRLIRIIASKAPNHKLPQQAPVIETISTASKQG